ncbi:MAG: hypothetical protein AB7U20_04845 [Planctomycetaceae bacterium]
MRNVLAVVCLCSFAGAVAVSLAPLRAADDADLLVPRVYPVADLPVWSLGDEKPRFDPSVLIAHIKSTVDPESWKDAAIVPWKDAAIVGHEKAELACLVVRQTRANHDKVADVIRSLRPKHPGEEAETLRTEDVLDASRVSPK